MTTNMMTSLAIAMVIGLIFTRIVKLVHLPNVTGYLIAGLLAGPCVLNIVSQEQLAAMDVIISAALGFIAFSIGGEFKWSHLKQIGTKAVLIAFMEATTAVVVVIAVLIIAGYDLPLALALGAIAAATAPAATLMVVRQYKAKGPVTSTLLPVVAMDDAVGLMLFSVAVAVAQSLAAHEQMSLWTMVGKPLLEIAGSLLTGAVIGLAASVAMKFFHSRNNYICVIIAAVLLGVGLAELGGLSSLLLCMAIGAAVANLRTDSDQLMEYGDRWTPPIFMLFFVLSGAELDLYALPAVGLLGLLYILFRVAGKYLGAYLGCTFTGAEPTVKKYLGITLFPQAGVAIGMAQMSSTLLPQYSSVIRTVILCATLIYELAGPVLTKAALTRAGEIKTPDRTRTEQQPEYTV